MYIFKYYPAPVYSNYVCQLIFSGNILHYCVHCTLHVGCCSKSLSESSGSEVYTDPLQRLGSKRSCSEGSMEESSRATVEGMYMCARSLAAYCACTGGTVVLCGYVQCDVHTVCPCYVVHCTSHCTPHCTSHCIFVILYITSTVHPSGFTMNIIITESLSTHHPPQSNGDHFTWSESKRRHLEEGVYWTVYLCARYMYA